MALRLSVKARVTAWFTALMLLVTAAALGFIVALGGTMLEGIAKANLSRAVQVNAGAVEYYRDERSEKFELDDDFSPNIFGSRCAVYTGEGRLLTGVMPDGLGAGEPFVAGPPRLVSGGGQRFYICDLPISGGALWVRGVTTAEEAEVFFSSMARLSFVILPVLVLIGAAGGYFIVRRAFRPIDRMIAAADAINEGSDLSARIGLPPKDDEIHRIAAAFDRMLARLEASFESEKQFASDASHELRTPTAVILAQCAALEKEGLTEKDYKKGISAIDRQAQKMSRLISRLLNITRLEQGTVKAQFERADLSELASVVCREMSSVHPDAELSSEIEPEIYAELDVALMSRLIENLVENAFKYGGGKVRVTLRREEGNIKLAVIDDGAGIPPEELPKIWQRFYRSDKSRSSGGLGLGLSLVKQIAGLHNARVTAESELGKGSVFTLTMAER